MKRAKAFAVQVCFDIGSIPRALRDEFDLLGARYEGQERIIHHADDHHLRDAMRLLNELRDLTARMDACAPPLREKRRRRNDP